MKFYAVLLLSALVIGNVNAQGIKLRYGDGGGVSSSSSISRKMKNLRRATTREMKSTSKKSKKAAAISNPNSPNHQQELLCPTGEEACCDTSSEECRDLVFDYEITFQEKVLGDVDWRDNKSTNNDDDDDDDAPVVTIPINLVLDQAVRDEKVGTYNAMTPNGKSFTFTMDEILYTSEDILEQASLLLLSEQDDDDDDSSPPPPLDQDDLQLIAETRTIQTVFKGSVNAIIDSNGDGSSSSSSPFVGSVVSSIDPSTGTFAAVLMVLEDVPDLSAPLPDIAGGGGRLLVQEPQANSSSSSSSSSSTANHHHHSARYLDYDELGCTTALEGARLAFQCQDPAYAAFTQDELCEANLIDECEAIVEAARIDYEKQVDIEKDLHMVLKSSLVAYDLYLLGGLLAGCIPAAAAGGPVGYLACVGAGIAAGTNYWAARWGILQMADVALDLAISEAVKNRDAIIDAAVSGPEGIASKAMGCFQCCDATDPSCCADDNKDDESCGGEGETEPPTVECVCECGWDDIICCAGVCVP